MLPTEKAQAEIDRQRWTPDPETEAAMDFVTAALTRPEIDGKSMLERVYLVCDFEAQRDEEVRTAAFAILKDRFKDERIFFKADCPDYGPCSFELRIADSLNDLQHVVPAKRRININLLKPHEEWIRPPLLLTKPAPAARKDPARPAPNSNLKSTASPKPGVKSKPRP